MQTYHLKWCIFLTDLRKTGVSCSHIYLQFLLTLLSFFLLLLGCRFNLHSSMLSRAKKKKGRERETAGSLFCCRKLIRNHPLLHIQYVHRINAIDVSTFQRQMSINECKCLTILSFCVGDFFQYLFTLAHEE